MLKFLRNGNHGVVFQIYAVCCLIFVFSSILLTLGFFALLLLAGVISGIENSVV